MTLRELITSLNLPYFSMFLFNDLNNYNHTNLRHTYDVYDNVMDVLIFKNAQEFFVNNEDANIDLFENLEVLAFSKVLENDADNAFKVLLKVD